MEFFRNSASRILTIAVLGLLLLGARPAHAIQFSLFGAVDYAKPSSNSTRASYAGALGYGGGALLSFAFTRRLGLELGGIYLQRKFKETISGATTTFMLNGVQIPLFFKFWIAKFLSVGVGGYYDRAVGKLKATDAGGVATTYAYGDTPLKTYDYGLLVGGGLNFQIARVFAFFIDGRYAYGISSAVTRGAFYHNDAIGMVGLRFGSHPLAASR